MRSGLRTVLELSLPVVAAALLWWSLADAREARARMPVIPVRGTSMDIDPTAADVASTAEEEIEGEGTLESPFHLPFRLFSFPDYDPPSLRPDTSPLTAADMPDTIRRFDGRYVEVEGNMIAIDYDNGLVGGCILSRYPQGCCFGVTPVLDEWIDVKTAPDLKQSMDGFRVTVRIIGRLEMGEQMAGDRVESLYRITDARLKSLW